MARRCQDMDTLAEWLRRRPAKPMGTPRVGSNPTGVAFVAAPEAPAQHAQDTTHADLLRLREGAATPMGLSVRACVWSAFGRQESDTQMRGRAARVSLPRPSSAGRPGATRGCAGERRMMDIFTFIAVIRFIDA